MSHLTRIPLLIVSLAAGVPLLACGDTVEPSPDGRLEVSWEVSPRGCAESGVESVQIDLEYERGVETETFPCQKETATVEDLEPANYTVRVWGLDEAGDSIFGAGPREVTVQSDERKTLEAFRLTAQPGELRVSWQFDNGRLCGFNEVDSLALALYDMSDVLIDEKSVECTAGQDLLGEVPPGSYQLELRAESDGSGFVALEEVDIERGKTTEVDVVLKSDDGE